MSRRSITLLVAAALVSGVAAFFLYFWLPSPLLDGTRLASFSYGPQGINLRELEVRTREDEGDLLDEIVRLANEAPLASAQVERREGAPMVVLFRDDGLQFVLIVGDAEHVGISEGDGSYLGTLQSPELAGLVTALVAESAGG
jgi:hypothetical protein